MKTLRTVLALILCVCLLPLAAFSVLAADTNALLASLTVDEFTSIGTFDPYDFDYEMVVPYQYEKNNPNNFFVPTVTAVAEDPNATVDVTYVNDPACGPTSIQVKVTAANGVASNRYTISLIKVGQNLYADGGFEQENTWNRYGGATISYVYDDVYAGNSSLKVVRASNGYYTANNAPVLTAGKNYIASSVLKLDKGAAIHETYNRFESGLQGTKTYWDEDGTQRTDEKVTVTSAWQRTFALVNPTAEYSVNNHFTRWGADPTILLDEYYIGELAVAEVVITDAEGNRRNSFSSGEAKSIQLSAKPLNQFGNQLGFAEADKTIKEWKLTGAPSGVTISENGLLTVPAGTANGIFAVEAVVEPTCNTIQGEVKGKYTVSITENTVALADIAISEPMVIDFDNSTTYTVDVPYVYDNEQRKFNISMPVVTPVAESGIKTKVIYPAELLTGEKIVIDVESADGTAFKTYMLSLNLVGGNLYEDGGFEHIEIVSGNTKFTQWNSFGSSTVSVVNDAYAGVYAMQVERSSNGHYYAKPRPQIQGNKNYLASSVVKLGDGADEHHTYFTSDTKVGSETTPVVNGTITKSYYNSVGQTIDSKVKVTSAWQRTFANIHATEGNTINTYYTTWDKEASIIIDEQYLGELVIAKVSVTDEKGRAKTSMSAPETGAKTMQLSAKPLNQFGNKAGVKDETVREWRLVGAPSGVSISENGLLTINAGTANAVFTVEAIVEPEYAVQNAVKGVYTVSITDDTVELSDIKLNAPLYIDFDSAETEYTVDVPYHYDYEQKKLNITMPVVTPVADTGVKTKVTYPKAIIKNAEILVEVESADGMLFNEYKLILNPVGGNLYEDGGFEQGIDKWNRLGATISSVDDAYAGTKALQIKRDANGSYWAKTQPSLKEGQSYIAFNVIKLDAGAEAILSNGKPYEPRNYFEGSGATIRYWNENGTEKTGDTASRMYPTHEWQKSFATLDTTATFGLKNYYTIWGEEPTILVDEYYVGDVVIADVSVTDAGGEDEVNIVVPKAGTKTVSLTANALNQFGNTIGLAGQTTVAWKVVGAPTGITVDNGLVTVGAAAQSGKYTIVAEVTPTYKGAVQEKVIGIYELTVTDNKFTFKQGAVEISAIQKGDITCTMSYTNETDAAVTGTFYIALYTVDDNKQLQLKVIVPQSVTVEPGKTGTPYGTITVPNDSNKYAVKCYFWTNDLKPIMVSGGIK